MSGIQSSINKLIAGVVGAQELKFNAMQKQFDKQMMESDKRLSKAQEKTESVVAGLQNLDISMMEKATMKANDKIKAQKHQRTNLKKRLMKKMLSKGVGV